MASGYATFDVKCTPTTFERNSKHSADVLEYIFALGFARLSLFPRGEQIGIESFKNLEAPSRLE